MNSQSPSPSTREIEIRRKVDENRKVVEQGIKISWHPHLTIYPWEVVSVRVSEHQHWERTPRGVVSWTEQVERVNEEMRGRPKTDQRAQWHQVEPSGTLELCNCQTENEWQTWRDEQTKKGKSVIKYSELRHESCQFSEKEWFVSGMMSWGDCHFVREFFNFQPAINKNSQRLNRNGRETYRIHSHSKTNDRNGLSGDTI